MTIKIEITLSCFLLTSIEIQCFFAFCHVIADRSNLLHLGDDFDASYKNSYSPSHSFSCFLASPRLARSRSTFFPFSTRRFFRLAFQFEMQKSFRHSRLNPESCCRRLILNSLVLFFAHNVTFPLSFMSLPKLDYLKKVK